MDKSAAYTTSRGAVAKTVMGPLAAIASVDACRCWPRRNTFQARTSGTSAPTNHSGKSCGAVGLPGTFVLGVDARRMPVRGVQLETVASNTECIAMAPRRAKFTPDTRWPVSIPVLN